MSMCKLHSEFYRQQAKLDALLTRRCHTITEGKNGEGATYIKTARGWLHIAHGVRNTAEGLRYVIYLYVTDLKEPWKVIAEPAGFFDRAAWLGAGQRCFQRGIYQWRYCG